MTTSGNTTRANKSQKENVKQANPSPGKNDERTLIKIAQDDFSEVRNEPAHRVEVHLNHLKKVILSKMRELQRFQMLCFNVRIHLSVLVVRKVNYPMINLILNNLLDEIRDHSNVYMI